jgi:hypothetical protein
LNRRSSKREITLYSEWIDNDRHAKALLAQMRELATKATQMILEEEPGLAFRTLGTRFTSPTSLTGNALAERRVAPEPGVGAW